MVIQKEPKSPRSIDPKIPRDLETICLKCLEKDPDRRYQSAKELADDLRRYLNRFAILAKRAGPVTRLKKWVKRNPMVAGLSVCVLFALALAGYFAWHAESERQQRLTDERIREEQALIEKRRSAIDKAILAAMSSQFAEADSALLDAERLGADLAERRFVAGILSQYRGDSESAKRLLLEACGEKPDWVAPRAFLAVVCNYIEDWAGEAAHGNAMLALNPVTYEDYLFRSYAIGFTNPRRGLPDVEEAWSRRHSVLAQFIRSELLLSLADESGRVEDAVEARNALQGARAYMGDSPLVTFTSLYIHCIGCNNCRLNGRFDEARQWLADGLKDFRNAEAENCRKHPASLQGRSIYLFLRDGSAESLDAENREAGRKGLYTTSCVNYLTSLFRKNKQEEALDYLPSVRNNDPDAFTFVKASFLVGPSPSAAQAECHTALTRNARPLDRNMLCYTLSLSGLPDEARRQSKVFRESPFGSPNWDELNAIARRASAHAFEGQDMDVEVEIGKSRWKRFIVYDTLGFAALGRGNRDEAVRWFLKSAEHPPIVFVTYQWMQAIRKRVIEDPTWPPWLASKK
jgi:hypothetical protein